MAQLVGVHRRTHELTLHVLAEALYVGVAESFESGGAGSLRTYIHIVHASVWMFVKPGGPFDFVNERTYGAGNMRNVCASTIPKYVLGIMKTQKHTHWPWHDRIICRECSLGMVIEYIDSIVVTLHVL